ncbi:hypothetical protein BH09CHL1_BH09CHL1_34060 [soil metagenome]
MDRAERIAKYAAGYDEVVAALEGITPPELDAREGPVEWSPRQIVHHLSDSEMTSAIRIRRIIVEDNPVIQGYDERAFVDLLFTDGPIETALAGFAGARSSTVPILQRMTDEQWAKFGTHSETGIMTAESWLEYYSNHAHDHAAQIRRARAAV